jgi:uncharacterized repeat protein (TIGR03806 family)
MPRMSFSVALPRGSSSLVVAAIALPALIAACGGDAKDLATNSPPAVDAGADGELPARPTNPTCRAPARVPMIGGEGLPATLSASGCFDPQDATRPLPALIPYAVNVPLWSDGADKDRWLALPDGARIAVDAAGDWQLPNGAVLIKTFRKGERRLETRFFVHQEDGKWAGYTYAWNDAGTDAVLLDEGRQVRRVGDQDWYFPSRAECLKCHTEAAGGSLGLETLQLNRAVPGEVGGANQLARFSALGLLEQPIDDPAALPALPQIDDGSTSVERRARAYLHANCANCHRPEVGNSGTTDLRFATSLAGTMSCGAEPRKGSLGYGADYRIIAPGQPDKSMLIVRMRELGSGRMPEIASSVVDTAGVSLLSDWIRALPGCP